MVLVGLLSDIFGLGEFYQLHGNIIESIVVSQTFYQLLLALSLISRVLCYQRVFHMTHLPQIPGANAEWYHQQRNPQIKAMLSL